MIKVKLTNRETNEVTEFEARYTSIADDRRGALFWESYPDRYHDIDPREFKIEVTVP